MFIVFGLVMIVVGLVCLFAKDIVWELTDWQNRTKGLQSDRTPEWETSINISGVVAIVTGIFFIFVQFRPG